MLAAFVLAVSTWFLVQEATLTVCLTDQSCTTIPLTMPWQASAARIGTFATQETCIVAREQRRATRQSSAEIFTADVTKYEITVTYSCEPEYPEEA